MWLILTDRVAWSVGLSVAIVNPTTMAKPTEMWFGIMVCGLGWAGPKEPCVRWVQISPCEGQF